MILNTIEELKKLFNSDNSAIELNEECYSKTIYVDSNIFDELVKYSLDFEPYKTIAEKCLMTSVQIMKSEKTNRFYIGFMNLGGHGARCEVRPVRLKEVLNFEYVEKMFADYGQELDRVIDIKLKYEV